MQNTTNYRVAIYCRAACADQLMIDRQEEFLRSYAKEHGYSNLVVYLDNGYSGLNFDRVAFSQLNADITAKKIDAVIVKDESRIGRNTIEVLKWIQGLVKKGIAFITAEYPHDTELLADIHQIFHAYMRSQKGTRPSKNRTVKV